MSSCVRRAHPVGYKSSTRNADIWQRWFQEFGSNKGFKDISSIDSKIEQKITNLRGDFSPNMFLSECSISRGSLSNAPLLYVTAGMYHQVPYYQWRAPNVVESFMGVDSEEPMVWRRNASHSIKNSSNVKNWIKPCLPLPMDSAVSALSAALSEIRGCSVHISMLDAQWYVGGPGKNTTSSRELWRFGRDPWAKQGIAIAHAAVWLGSPKIIVDYRFDFAKNSPNKHRRIISFIIATLKLHIGSTGFLKAARVEMKGRIGGVRRKKSRKMSVGAGDSLISDSCWVRSYQRSISTKKGVVRLRVILFYSAAINQDSSMLDGMDKRLVDAGPQQSAESVETGATSTLNWLKWLEQTSTLVDSWKGERYSAPSKNRWGFEIETLSQHLELFRKRGLERYGFWNRSREHPSRHFDPSTETWINRPFKGWSSDRNHKEPFNRRIDEFTGVLPEYLENQLPQMVGNVSKGTSIVAKGGAMPTLSSLPTRFDLNMLGPYQRDKLAIFQKRRTGFKQRTGRQFYSSMESNSDESNQSSQTPFDSFSEANTPWWFSQLENLHMTRQYWKQKNTETRRSGWGPKTKTKALFVPWMKGEGVRKWQSPNTRLFDVLDDSKGYGLLAEAERLEIQPKNHHIPQKRKVRQHLRIRKFLSENLNLS